MFITRVTQSGLSALSAGSRALLLDEDVADEVIYHHGADWRISPRPDDDSRGRQDFECVQHCRTTLALRRSAWKLATLIATKIYALRIL